MSSLPWYSHTLHTLSVSVGVDGGFGTAEGDCVVSDMAVFSRYHIVPIHVNILYEKYTRTAPRRLGNAIFS